MDCKTSWFQRWWNIKMQRMLKCSAGSAWIQCECIVEWNKLNSTEACWQKPSDSLSPGRQWSPRGPGAGRSPEPVDCHTPEAQVPTLAPECPVPTHHGSCQQGAINNHGISSTIGWNSKYATAVRIKVPLPKRNQEKQWTLECSLEVCFPRGLFCLLPVNVSVHRKDQ